MNTNKIFSILAAVGVGVTALIAVTTGLNLFFFWSVFDWFQSIIRAITGMDSWLNKAFAAFAMAVIAVLPLGRILMSFSPIPQKDKNKYRAMVFGVLGLFFLFAYFGAKDTFFDSKTGQYVKYYSMMPDGTYKFYSEEGYDPLTGDKLKPVTKEVILRSKGLWPKPAPPPPPPAPYVAPQTYQEPPRSYVPPRQREPVISQEEEPEEEPASEPEEPKIASLEKKEEPRRELTLTVPPIKKEATAPIKFTTPVTFNNDTRLTIRILNNAARTIFNVNPYAVKIVEMNPGVYYFSEDGWNKKQFLVVAGKPLDMNFHRKRN